MDENTPSPKSHEILLKVNPLGGVYVKLVRFPRHSYEGTLILPCELAFSTRKKIKRSKRTEVENLIRVEIKSISFTSKVYFKIMTIS